MTDPRAAVPTWVIGAGGLLGGSVTRQLRGRGRPLITTPMVPWHDSPAALDHLRAGVAALAGRGDARYRVAWCAGAGVTGTPESALLSEVEVLTQFLSELGRLRPGTLEAFFFASSAGALYAGSSRPPFTESHLVAPISPYGRAKYLGEQAVEDFAASAGVPTVIGRISNLYGAGQNLGKGQGLISHLCWGQLNAQPVSIYVSLDTMRDYLFSDDCAAMVVDSLDRAASSSGLRDRSQAACTVKIFASHQPATIGALLGECRRVFRRPPLVVLGSSPAAQWQIRDLRLRSAVWPSLDRRAVTPLPVGIHATMAGLRRVRRQAFANSPSAVTVQHQNVP